MLRRDNVIRPSGYHNHKIMKRSIFHFDDNKSPNKDPPKSCLKKTLENIESYCDRTTLHGLRYIGDTSLTTGERIFWLVAFCCAVSFAFYFISSIYIKWDLSPVIISFSPSMMSLASIPFPAVTICNMNQAKKNEAEKILKNGSELYRRLLEDYCSLNGNTSYTLEDYYSTKWDNVFNFILQVGQSCTDMIKVCRWERADVDCTQIFNSELTDEGLCCSFNKLPNDFIFKKPKELALLNITHPIEVIDWNPQNGYSPGASHNATPWRPTGAGTHLGLTLVLDAQVNNYYCSSTNSVGFKIVLSSPMETPKIADFGFLLTPGFESRVAINPTITEATASLQSVPVSKRQCFFINENYLRFYRRYSERNCKLECQANYTLEKCDCVPYFLPKGTNTKICGKKQEICSTNAKETMETVMENGTHCNCLPSCYDIVYGKSTSFARMTHKFKIREDIIKDNTPEYFLENIAVVHFYFSDSQFVKRLKSEIYGFSEFLSNTGGLLGLFLGFSFLSAVEIVYFVSLRGLCVLLKKRRRKHTKIDNERQIVILSLSEMLLVVTSHPLWMWRTETRMSVKLRTEDLEEWPVVLTRSVTILVASADEEAEDLKEFPIILTVTVPWKHQDTNDQLVSILRFVMKSKQADDYFDIFREHFQPFHRCNYFLEEYHVGDYKWSTVECVRDVTVNDGRTIAHGWKCYNITEDMRCEEDSCFSVTVLDVSIPPFHTRTLLMNHKDLVSIMGYTSISAAVYSKDTCGRCGILILDAHSH